MKPSAKAIIALLEGSHADPFSLLGLHEGPDGVFARAILPGAETAEAHELGGKKLGKLKRVNDRGLFEGKVNAVIMGYVCVFCTRDQVNDGSIFPLLRAALDAREEMP